MTRPGDAGSAPTTHRCVTSHDRGELRVVGPGGRGAVAGLDRNEAMLGVARRLRPDLRWQAGDACALPFPDGSFDVVLSQAG